MTDAPGRFEVKTTAESHFSWLRTRLSVERTLMSWVRTAVALIGFGFTIVQFFERLPALSATRTAVLPEAPRYLGLALIAAGILSLLVSGINIGGRSLTCGAANSIPSPGWPRPRSRRRSMSSRSP